MIETLTTGRMIHRGLMVNQQRYGPSDRNTDYWADDTPGTNGQPVEVWTQ